MPVYDALCPECGFVEIKSRMAERHRLTCPRCGRHCKLVVRQAPTVAIPRRYLNGITKEEIY